MLPPCHFLEGNLNAQDQVFRALAEYMREHNDSPAMICVSPYFDKLLLLGADIHQWMNPDINAPPRSTFAGIPYAVMPEQFKDFMLEDA